MSLENLFEQVLIDSLRGGTYNGHGQLQLPKDCIPLDDIPAFVEDIESIVSKEYDTEALCYAKVYSDRGFGVYVENFWADGEHELGHKDKLLLTVGE